MLVKKLIRTAGKYKAQFISMILMTALGIGVFLGFNMEWVSLEHNTMSFMEQTGFADYRIYSEDGFSEKDAEAIRQIEGVTQAVRYLSLNAQLVKIRKSAEAAADTAEAAADTAEAAADTAEAAADTAEPAADTAEPAADTAEAAADTAEAAASAEEALQPAAGDAGSDISSEDSQSATLDKTLAVTVTENPEVSGFILMEGQEYDENSEDGLWLSDRFAEINNIQTGDELELSYESFVIKGVVKGLVESSEYMICVRDESQIMPDFTTYGYVYMSPAALQKVIRETVEKELLEKAKTLLGKHYTEESARSFVDKKKDSVLDQVQNQVFCQINVLSDLPEAEFKNAVRETMGKTMVILTKDETISYAEAKGEASEGRIMGSVLPVLFLLISILTMVTTMHRIAVNEKTQIGTLKALGFKNRRILRHYGSYSAMTGLIGALAGIGIGYLIAWFILNPDGAMGTYITMPEWKLLIPWWCWLVIVLVVILIAVTGRISVRSMMKGTAADALRPYIPKVSRPMLLERTGLWNRLGFGTRWNLRDIMRHKSRSAVTLVGIIGCMILLVAAIGMYETANAFIEITYTENARYESRIYMSTSAENEDALDLAEEYQGDYSASVSVQMEDETYSLDIYQIRHDLIRFIDRNNNPLELGDDGAFVSLRMQEKYHLKEGDVINISLFGSDASYDVKIAGFNRSLTESITISENYAQKLVYERESLTESTYYRIGSIYTGAQKSQIGEDARIATVQSKSDIADSMDGFMQVLYMGVGILVLAAVVLGIVVLYNLGVMSYAERYREMATLKVVGFKGRRIRRLLVSQNIWLTVIGVIVGFFAGMGVLEYLMAAMAPEYEMKVMIGLPTILISVCITFGVSLLVGVLVARKSGKIDMVSALKMPE